MTASLSHHIKWLILSLLIVAGFNTYLSAQTSISGVINQYARVNSIGADYVIIDDETQFDQFAVGDTVLLMQMKGVRIYAIESVPSSYGVGSAQYGQPGTHEFLTILSIDDGTNTIVFRNNIVHNSIDVIGDIQLIKVPSYNFAIVDGQLTCQPWDSTTKTGGVLAAIIGRTLLLNANIDVTGKGFKGGKTESSPGICITTNVTRWDKLSYHIDSVNAGFKGEGLAIRVDTNGAPYPLVYPGYAKGKAANFTGGGGGNGRYSGGGGGSNYGAGAKGGRENNLCIPTLPGGGWEGKAISETFLKGGMFLGGGGGGSTYTTGTPVSGGSGGGMIFLVCDTLMGNGHSILAEGEFPGTSSGDAGAGGGGGAGSIAIYLQSYSDNTATSAITISANGGHGGNNAGNSGEGGGGGGGYINTTDVPLPANVIKTVSGGIGGTRSGVPGLNGLPGTDSTTFIPLLNGFLFNSITSSVTGTQIDSICSNVTPEPINGTNPVGGSGSYTYLWQKKDDLAGLPADITGSNTKDFIFSAPEADTFWIRRVVKDDITFLTDTSKWVNIRVQPEITGNLVGEDTTICYNQDPLSLAPLNAGPSNGNGFYQYQWIQSLNADMSGAVSSPNTSDQASYDPPALTDTTYFKRVVVSGRCVDQSSAVTITVLPSITGNITDRPDSIICEGSLFNTLGASITGGGSGSYEYLWQDSTASGIWAASPNANDAATYTPDTSTFAVTEKRYYRRVVFSGPNSVCRSNSAPVLMTRYHYIKNNTISKDTTICSGTVPPPFEGTTDLDLEGGSLIYTYMWQDSSKAASWTTQGTAMSPYSPPALTDSTWYRRIVNSSKCADTSNILVINVHKPIENNIASFISASGSDTTICSGAVPNKIKGSIPTGGTDIPGDYAYQWSSSADKTTFTDISGANNIEYQPEALTATTWFKRKVISGKCFSESNTIEIIVLPDIFNNVISSDQTICYGTTPAQLTGTGLTGGAGGTPTWIWEESDDGINWETALGTGDEQNYSPPTLTDPIKYRRVILSGPYNCCADTSEILEIGIHPLPTGEIISVTDTICNGTEVLLNVTLTGAQPWKLVYSENSTDITVDNISNSNAVISRVPEATAAMSSFSYSLVSVEDDNGCIATSLTGTRKADVYRVPVAEAGPDDEVCGPEYTLTAVPSDGTGLWTFPLQVLESDINDPATTIKIDSSFTDAYVAYKFYWEETNWECKDKDSVTVTFYNRIDNIDAGNDTILFSFDYIMQLNAAPIETFETGKWSVIAGAGDFDDDTANYTNVRNISMGKNTFKWIVTNGECMLEDMIDVTVYDLMIPEGFSPNNDPENYNNTFIISGLDLRKKLSGSDSVPAYQIAELTIVNGAGNQVFTTSNKSGNQWKNWDGRNNDGIEMPEGTYYYLLKITSVEVPGEVFKKSGFIILKRY